jgi:hypothetical protein
LFKLRTWGSALTFWFGRKGDGLALGAADVCVSVAIPPPLAARQPPFDRIVAQSQRCGMAAGTPGSVLKRCAAVAARGKCHNARVE